MPEGRNPFHSMFTSLQLCQTAEVSLDSSVLPYLAPGDQPKLWEKEVAAWRLAIPTSR